MDNHDEGPPPALPPRPKGPRDPYASGPAPEPFVPLQRTVAALNKQAISLYVTRLPGTDNLLLTPTRPASSGITHFDVNYGAYLVQYDDQELYHDEVNQFHIEQAQKATEEATQKRITRVPAPANVPADVANAKKSALEETALDKLLREEMQREAAMKSKPLAQLQNLGEQIRSHKPKALPDQNELRNLHQVPLAARGLIALDAKPMILHRIGVLPGQSREIGEVARLLDTWRRPSRRRFTRSHSRDGPVQEEESDSAGYIDMLEQMYEPFGTDVNYISPAWIKVFTRRISKWKGHIDEDFVVLSPWQGHLVFQSSKVRNTITCWHVPPHSAANERIIVSELRLNVYPQATTTTTRRSERPSSSDENRSISPVQRSLGSFPSRIRHRGASESSPLNSVTAAAASSEKRDGRVSRLLQKVSHAPRGLSPPKIFKTGRQERSSSNATQASDLASNGDTTVGQAEASVGRGKRNSMFNFSGFKARFSVSSDEAALSTSPPMRHSDQANFTHAPTITPPPPLASPTISRSSGDFFEAPSHNSSSTNLPQFAPSTSFPSLLDAEDAHDHTPMDLSLGQERLGGGLRGRDAKLAKIVVHGEGQQMLDLVVAANMILFCRAFALSRGEV